jgi:putative non-specific DNA binding protein
VRLGDIGSFRLTIKAEGAATAVEAKTKGAKLIKKVNVQFTKSTAMRDSFDIRSLNFAPQEDIVNAK